MDSFVYEIKCDHFLDNGCRVDKNRKQNGKQNRDKIENLVIRAVTSGSTVCKTCILVYGVERVTFLWQSKPLTLVLLNPDVPCFANSVDPDQLASEEAN